MDILVTGSAGFVGGELVPLLQDLGHYVIGVDLEPDSKSDKFYQIDLKNKRKLPDLKFDICIHLASEVGGIIFNNRKTGIEDVNQLINSNVLETCKSALCETLIFFSSINVFESNNSFHHGPLRGIDQVSPYALSKAKSESFFKNEFKNYIVIRPTNLFGASQARLHENYGESHVIPDLLKKIDTEKIVEVFGDGSQVRNFIHISDISKFVVKILNLKGHSYLNLRTNNSISIRQLISSLILYRDSNKKLFFNAEYMKYEIFKIEEFDLSTPTSLGWEWSINEIIEGLAK
jgi:UDP-glucose 4-epimerase